MRSRHKNSQRPAEERLANLRTNMAGFLTQCVYNRSIQIRKEIPRKELEEVLTEAIKTWVEYQKLPPIPPPTASPPKDQLSKLSDIGIGIWRLRMNIEEQNQRSPSEGLKRASRHLDTIWEAYKNAGFQIIDQKNQPFNSGMDLKVITFEKLPGLERETIVETIRPTIFYQNQLLTRGEVVVGIPDLPEQQLESSH